MGDTELTLAAAKEACEGLTTLQREWVAREYWKSVDHTQHSTPLPRGEMNRYVKKTANNPDKLAAAYMTVVGLLKADVPPDDVLQAQQVSRMI